MVVPETYEEQESPNRRLWNELKDHEDDYLWDDDDGKPCPTAMNILSRNLNIKTMTREEEVDLFRRWQETKDPALRKEFLNRNLRLVAAEAKKVSHHCDYDIPDLIGWGTMGLCRAFDKFDLDKNCKFSTYAVLWIRQCMFRELDNTSHTIKIPCNIIGYQRKLKKFLNNYRGRYQDDPTDEELIEVFGWAQEKLDYIRKGMTKVSSIDVPTADGEDSIIDLIQDDNAENAPDAIVASERAMTIRKVILEALDERDADILLNLAELNGKDSLTEAQLAKKYKITRERVKQIKQECLITLRHPSKSRKLISYYDV